MIIAGIDAGGTSTKCLIVSEQGEILAESSAGPANFQTVGLSSAGIEINKALKLAMRKAGVAVIDLLGIGLAGAGRENDLNKFRSYLLPVPGVSKTYLTNDAEIAVLASRGGEPGLVLIAGTGSIAYGLKQDGSTVRSGGWGPILGDEGSGFWLGLEALKAVIKAVEKRSSGTMLTDLVKEQLKLEDWTELISWIYQGNLPREQIAGLAPAVISAATAGDEAADMIITGGIDELVSLVSALAAQLNQEVKEVTVTGGLFSDENFYQLFAGKLEAEYGLQAVRPIFSAVAGAVIYALKQAEMMIDLNKLREER